MPALQTYDSSQEIQAANSPQTLSVGIVGAGDIVSKVHLPTLFTLKNVSVNWITDRDGVRAQKLARAFKVPFAPLPASLSELPPADVVLLAIPYGARHPYYTDFRDRSCAFYVEKPFARTVERHQEICSWYPEYNVACGFQQRSWGPAQQLRTLIEVNLFGRLRSIRYGFGSPGVIVRGGYQSSQQLAGGGILFDVGIHGIDALLFISSAVSAKIGAVHMQIQDGLDLHTDAQVSLTTEQGETVDCRITVSCLEETSSQLEFVFDNARVIYSYPNGLAVKPLRGKGTYLISEARAGSPLTSFQVFHEHWDAFLNGVRTKRRNCTSAVETILTTEVIEGLYTQGASSSS